MHYQVISIHLEKYKEISNLLSYHFLDYSKFSEFF